MKVYPINSIRHLHELLALPKPKHPLISVIDFAKITCFTDQALESVTYGFYCIALKKNFSGVMRYGQQPHDFDDGTMTFFAPNQVVTTQVQDTCSLEGDWLVVHAGFLQGFSLARNIRQFGFFSYAVNEALHLSEDEERMIRSLMADIARESRQTPDKFSQTIIIKQIELLLSYCDRYYQRQFLTRKQAGNDHLLAFEHLLDEYFNSQESEGNQLPGVAYFADKLNLSPNYLSDMLRSNTGLSAQQHIQQKLIDKAKALLTSTELSVSEIAYRLGFEYPQSFSKLFKNKTGQTPKAFRTLYN
ncbi:helix-turn-helix domain-containing protein [Mucilaginibacter litoreus]|uniref:Helix-turn-helix domain-containing protein n=1 Tax=Mucilaginibacter litoreus TaxID=1048221 RepID=A0ABW3ATZ7_9SPHI